jgi:NinB protein
MAKNVLELSCLVSNGRIPLETSQAVAAAIRRMEGKRLVISLREQKRTRSNNQNAFYWAVVIPLVLEMFVEAGNDTNPEEVHLFLKENVGGSVCVKVLLTPDGKRCPVLRSSADLSTAEFEDFLERVRAWAAEMGTQIPLPNENLIYQGE